MMLFQKSIIEVTFVDFAMLCVGACASDDIHPPSPVHPPPLQLLLYPIRCYLGSRH